MTDDDAATGPGLGARLFVAMQFLLPQRAISALVYRAARWRWPPAKNLFIRVFLALYAPDLKEARLQQPRAYTSFNAFFTRELQPGARPLEGDAGTLVSPADGRLTEYGRLTDGQLIQAKGLRYSVAALLGSDDALTRLGAGQFATIYLAPHNYHRVHMPLSGTLTRMSFIPGRRFSVNEATTTLVTGLFTRNERVVCWFDTASGPLAVVLVGALNVASISTHWHGEVSGPTHQITHINYDQAKLQRYDRGAELGRFNLGSTVIVIAAAGTLR